MGSLAWSVGLQVGKSDRGRDGFDFFPQASADCWLSSQSPSIWAYILSTLWASGMALLRENRQVSAS